MVMHCNTTLNLWNPIGMPDVHPNLNNKRKRGND